jgi:hypothetical protein
MSFLLLVVRVDICNVVEQFEDLEVPRSACSFESLRLGLASASRIAVRRLLFVVRMETFCFPTDLAA